MISHTVEIDWQDVHYLRPDWTRQECESALENLSKREQAELTIGTVSKMLTNLDKLLGETNVNH